MNNFVLKDYIDTHFKERPTEEQNWKYQLRDMLDEWLYGFGAAGLFTLTYFLGDGFWNWLAIIGWIGCLIYTIRLLWVIILRRMCTSFTLTPDHFVYSHGLFNQKTETFQLSDIIQVTLQRSIWERMIRTGTIKIRFKTNTEIQHNPLVIRGIGKYQDMFKKIDYYRNHHRLVLYFGI